MFIQESFEAIHTCSLLYHAVHLVCVADATVIEELKRLQVCVNDFDVKGIIGRGHFGEIQVARERGTNSVYALKILRKADVLSQQNVSCMFEWYVCCHLSTNEHMLQVLIRIRICSNV